MSHTSTIDPGAASGARWDVLRHPLHERWLDGTLTGGELQAYASEHDHVVAALAAACRLAAERAGEAAVGATGSGRAAARMVGDGLARRLALLAWEARDQIDRWRAFARTSGWRGFSAWHYAEEPIGETVACARVLAGTPERTLAEHLAVLATLATPRPRQIVALREALVTRHGFAAGEGLAWFRHEVVLAADLADLARDGLAAELERGADAAALARLAESAQRAHWALLDGLEASVAYQLTPTTTGEPVAAAARAEELACPSC
jgi:pyrroloquinoline quinone (PQQ) biosynthesis protein C